MAVTTQFNLSIVSGDGVVGNASLSKVISGLSFVGISESYLQSQMIGVSPPATPSPTNGTGGSMSSGNYMVKITYVNAPQGESLPSGESSAVAVASSGTLTVPSPAASAPATGYNVYITAAGGATNTETKQNGATPIAIGTNYVQSAAVTSGGALPGSNTTLVFAPTLPQSPVQVFYVRNLATAGQTPLVTVTWTPQGGSSNKALDLVPQAAILFCEAQAGALAGGITALSITVGAVQTAIESFMAG